MSRYCNCAAKFEAKTIVRITSDCPLIDPEVVDKIVSFFLKKNFDYVSNTTPSLSRTWPNGSDVEVFSYEALKKLNKKKLNKFHREHVTTFFYKSKKFKSHQIKNNYDWSNYRYTMDYPEDLNVIKKIFGHLKRKKKFGYLPQIISILKQDKKIQKINLMLLKKNLINGFRKIGLRNGKVIMLYVNLKPFYKITNIPYPTLTNTIVKAVKYFKPKSILVPSFTYSVTKSKKFDVCRNKSEVGRFSEEIRLNFSKTRTLDPVFSVMDVKNWLANQRKINTNISFGDHSIWQRLFEKNCIMINLGIKYFVSTQVHYIEKIKNVSYRKNKKFNITILENERKLKNMKYTFFARDLGKNRLLNWKKIFLTLVNYKYLKSFFFKKIKISLIETKAFHKVLNSKINLNSYFLVEK